MKVNLRVELLHTAETRLHFSKHDSALEKYNLDQHSQVKAKPYL